MKGRCESARWMMSRDLELTRESPRFLFLDPGPKDRVVSLPEFAEDTEFWVIHSGHGSFDLICQQGERFLTRLRMGFGAHFVWAEDGEFFGSARTAPAPAVLAPDGGDVFFDRFPGACVLGRSEASAGPPQLIRGSEGVLRMKGGRLEFGPAMEGPLAVGEGGTGTRDGRGLLPAEGRKGDLLVFDGMRWVRLATEGRERRVLGIRGGMVEWVEPEGHRHTIEDIDGLEEAIEDRLRARLLKVDVPQIVEGLGAVGGNGGAVE